MKCESETMNFQQEYQLIQQEVEQALNGLIEKRDIPDCLKQAMSYSIFAGGKRLRPVLLIAACELLGGDRKECLPLACAIEMIHTYSLIHDDLPAMDDDEYRRGQLTAHIKFGEATAILAGDALLNLAMEVALENAISYPSNLIAHTKAANMIFNHSGSTGMIAGQVYDLEGENQLLSLNELKRIHRHKTVKLIVAPLMAGGIIANAKPEQLNALKGYGEQLGLAFQIQDDILDVVGEFNKLGKMPGSDVENNKNTYVSMLGLEQSKQEVMSLITDAIDRIKIFNHSEFLINLAQFMGKREH